MNIVIAARARAERGSLPNRPFAVVSITDPGASPAIIPRTPYGRGVLRLAFDDARPGDQPPDETQPPRLMTEQDARAIWAFVSEQTSVDTLVVQCEAGWSRSAAVGAAIAHVVDDYADRFFSSYSPNEYVFRTMLRTVPIHLLHRRRNRSA